VKKNDIPLPNDWKSRVRAVKNRSNGLCEVVYNYGLIRRRCGRPMTAVDHRINRAQWPRGQPGLHDLNNLQAICGPCHDIKTKMERMGKSWVKWIEGGGNDGRLARPEGS